MKTRADPAARGCRLALAGLVIIALAACALPIRNDVTVFHDWPAGLDQRSFRLVPRPELAQDLEYQTYRRIVREQLLAAGFVETAVPVLDVSFTYDTREKRTRVIERSPAFSSSLYFGHGYSGGALAIGVPLTWGPYYDSHYDAYTYERELRLEMADRRTNPPVRIYQATASNRGSEPARVEALPYLVQAVLRDFPGRSGIARMVEIERQVTPAVPAAK
ncbi:MAG: DUF4136 domain-containing protein [Burkholderiaceae bacterium]